MLHANEAAAAEAHTHTDSYNYMCVCVCVWHATALAKLKLLHNKQRKLSEEPTTTAAETAPGIAKGKAAGGARREGARGRRQA